MRLAAVPVLVLLAVVHVSSAQTGLRAASAEEASPQTVLDLGDSLSIGTGPYLRRELRGYKIRRHYDVGLHAYDAAALVELTRASLPSALVISAGSNDDPRIVSTFIRAVSGVLRAAGPRRCVVWPTIVRPAAVGATYDGLNGALVRAAARHRNLLLVDWVGMVRRHPSWVSPDGVHVSVAGYRARAAAIGAAVTSRCTAMVG